MQNKNPGQNLCDALQGMGTTFIKLGQFLATRPDIIGEELTKNLEKLQDKLPPFSKSLAENIIRDELGELTAKNIENLLNDAGFIYKFSETDDSEHVRCDNYCLWKCWFIIITTFEILPDPPAKCKCGTDPYDPGEQQCTIM